MKYLIPPWQHQLDAIERAKDMKDFGLLFEMGTGKTGTAINILRHKYTVGSRVMRTLVLCPLIVCYNWKEEFAKHSKIEPDRIVILTGTPEQRKKKFARAKERYNGNFICITNYDKLVDNREVNGRKVNCSEDLQRFLEWGVEVLVADESHKCKDLTSHRTKAVLKLARAARHKYILTGTPILNGPEDLFSQFLILDDGQTFGEDFWNFKLRYMEDQNAKWKGKPGYFPKWTIKAGSLDEINSRIYTRAMRVTKDECLDLPPVVRKHVYVGMSGEQERLYKEMRDEFITFLGSDACVATMAITKALRLMQIASGYVKVESGKEIQLKNTPKMEALKELLEDSGGSKVIVWAVFKENYAQIRRVCDALKIKYVEVTGETHDKFAAVEQFNTDPETTLLLGNPGAGGIGINLTVSNRSIHYSRNFSLDHDLQARSRNHRGGSEIHKKITQIDLITQGTIEEAIVRRLENKEDISEAALKSLISEI
jgi:SNF2 family DNA or RNA helicase